MRFASRKQQNNTKRAGATTKNTHTKTIGFVLNTEGKPSLKDAPRNKLRLWHTIVFSQKGVESGRFEATFYTMM
jgi:hypothetical protein